MMNSSMPAALASSTAYWIKGLSTTGSISLGMALVAGKNRTPRPPTGKIALRTVLTIMSCLGVARERRCIATVASPLQRGAARGALARLPHAGYKEANLNLVGSAAAKARTRELRPVGGPG